MSHALPASAQRHATWSLAVTQVSYISYIHSSACILLVSHHDLITLFCMHLQAPYMIPQLRRLLEEGVYQPAPAPVPLGSIDFPQAERRSSARIIMTAAQRIPAFDGLTTVIQV
jgi:hypothetical protein